MEAFIAGAAAALIGVLSGQGVVLAVRGKQQSSKLAAIERALPELITRSEVQNAFAQVAQIEAQRMAQQQQQARQAAVFGSGGDSGGVNPAAAMNTQINEQLVALSSRINAINEKFGIG